ncbi:hypothetical protein, partial [Blautia wexlerae]|uniref:hypothetical protein n=1 Tax=Blautia wexlerae TaxID=418240 RepID=UPI0019635E8B
LFVFQSSVFRISEKLHNGKQGFALTRKTAVAWFVSFHVAAVCAVVIQLILYNSLFGKVFPLFISQILVYIHTFFNFSSNLSNCILDFAY